VVEILSPEETPAKIPFYASHGVDELVIVDPENHTVEWLALGQGQYRPSEPSRLIPLGPAELAERIDWPVVDPRRVGSAPAASVAPRPRR
jgi:Uma2 family endonuclease